MESYSHESGVQSSTNSGSETSQKTNSPTVWASNKFKAITEIKEWRP